MDKIKKLLEENNFTVNEDIISYHSFNAKLIKKYKNYYSFKGKFSLFGHEFNEDFSIKTNSNNLEIKAGGCNILEYNIDSLNIDIDDIDYDMLHNIGIHPYDINIIGNKIEIICHSINMYTTPENLLTKNMNIDKIKEYLSTIKNYEKEINKISEILKSKSFQ